MTRRRYNSIACRPRVKRRCTNKSWIEANKPRTFLIDDEGFESLQNEEALEHNYARESVKNGSDTFKIKVEKL